MSNYSDDFEEANDRVGSLKNSNAHPSTIIHTLRLTIDCLSAKDFSQDVDLSIKYHLKLASDSSHPI